jgi:hypothetical protein
MNDNPIQDPQRQSFEARLAAFIPRVSPQRKDELLYACAYAAGANAALPSLRRWKRATAVLCGLLCAVSLSHSLRLSTNTPTPIAIQTSDPPASPERQQVQTPMPPEFDDAHDPFAAKLDAWQLPVSSSESLSSQLAQLQHADPDHRLLTVSRLDLDALNP